MSKNRDWPAILSDAAKRNLSTAETAAEQGCSATNVRQMAMKYGIRPQATSDKHVADTSKAASARWANRQPPPSEPGEEWRSVPSYPGYYASTLGRVRSEHTVLKSHPRKFGHLYVAPSVSGRQKPEGVHRMVCEAFHGPCPPEQECRHLDGKPSNNLPGNLAWGTKIENQGDRALHGTGNAGERNGRAKLTDAQKEEIRCRISAGEKHRIVAAEFGIHTGHIPNIIHARTPWRAARNLGSRTSPEVAAAVNLVQSGVKTSEAARLAGANLTSVRCRVSELRRAGVLPAKSRT